jgi:hypothetical protein
MKNSDDESQAKSDVLRENGSAYGLDFPVDSDFPSDPPKGTWADGYRLSLLALRQVKNPPEIFEERSRRMCSAEFEL